MESVIETIYSHVLEGRNDLIEESIKSALEQSIPAGQVLDESLIAAMGEVGRRFEEGEYYVPEMLVAARSMKAGLAILRPYLVDEGVESRGKAVIGTVQGDLHDIGKNLVGMMLEGAGYEVIDLGTDVSPVQFAEAVRSHGADVLGISALLTTTMEKMPDAIEAVEDMGMRNNVKILVGGAPVTAAFAEEIGADGFAPDASAAVTLVNSLLS